MFSFISLLLLNFPNFTLSNRLFQTLAVVLKVIFHYDYVSEYLGSKENFFIEWVSIVSTSKMHFLNPQSSFYALHEKSILLSLYA